MDDSRPKLMIPGPVDIPEDVRAALAVPTMPHYGRDWIRMVGEVQEMAKRVFETQNELLVMPGTGTMALEAALGSALEPGSAVLVPVNGFFGERLVTIIESLGLLPVRIDVPPGEPILPEAVAAVAAGHPESLALAVVHHETSTGVLNPLEGIASVARERNLLLVVDAISSLGGVPVPVDTWAIDVCVTVANKALETPPGVALLSLSSKAWQLIAARRAPRGWYLDLRTWQWYAENWADWHPSPVTMPTNIVNALHFSLLNLLEEGIEVRHAAYRKASSIVRQGLAAMGFAMLAEEAYASPLTTAFKMREEVDAAGLQQALLQTSGIMVSGGIGALKGHILRVGHLGLARRHDYSVAFLLGVEAYVRRCGVALPVGISLQGLEHVS